MGMIEKRFAILVGHANETYQRQFIEGFLERTFDENIDVCVFSMYRKYQDTEEGEKGESNIFRLINYGLFSGIIYLKDSIQTTGVAEKLEKHIYENYRGPVLVIEGKSEYYKTTNTDGYYGTKIVVDHMIEEHGMSKLAFLNGKRWHPHSKMRLKAFKDSLIEHGLTVNEDFIFDGDFWYTSGETCADDIEELKDERPEAVVCACDQMAIGLCEALEKRGIRVPEDIAVVSYDSTEEGRTGPKSITSSLAPARECGFFAAEYLLREDRESLDFDVKPKLIIGESCGCKICSIQRPVLKRAEWATPISEKAYNSINDTIKESINNYSDMQDFLDAVYSFTYQLKGAKSFHLALNEPWLKMEEKPDIEVANFGYSHKMIYAIRHNSDNKDGIAGTNRTFNSSDILPLVLKKREKCQVFFFTPVFFNKYCFGYAAVAYSEPRCYDETYRLWISDLCVGLESLRVNLANKILQKKLDAIINNKFSAIDSRFEFLSREEKDEYELVEKILNENLLTYQFQPIVNATDGEIFAFEALMRATTDKMISPLRIIKFAGMQGRLSDIEFDTFMNVLEVVDKTPEVFCKTKIFINSIPGARVSEKQFQMIESLSKRNGKSIVVELTEEAELEDEDIGAYKEYFKKLGIEIALDDYGTGYSNIGNLLRYMPDYVKIDRSLLSGIQNAPQKQHFVKDIITFCHDNNIKALAEGVETIEELRMVIQLGADLIQGYYTGKPSSSFIKRIDRKIRNEIRACYRKSMNGALLKIYESGRTNRVPLKSLSNSNYTEILISDENVVYKDLVIAGAPALETDIHLKFKNGYSGMITLENAFFSNIKNRPCIELGENCNVNLVLQGINILDGGGIILPKSSKLIIEGEGDLIIRTQNNENIGDDEEKNIKEMVRGDVSFNQTGSVSVE